MSHVACLALLFVAAAPAATAPAPPAVSGTYSCQGEDFDGDTYSGQVRIVQTGDTYRLGWDVTFARKGSRAVYQGVGVLTDGTLAATWDGAGKAGVMLYKVEAGGVLAGRWTIIGNKTVRTETLTPARP